MQAYANSSFVVMELLFPTISISFGDIFLFGKLWVRLFRWLVIWKIAFIYLIMKTWIGDFFQHCIRVWYFAWWYTTATISNFTTRSSNLIAFTPKDIVCFLGSWSWHHKLSSALLHLGIPMLKNPYYIIWKDCFKSYLINWDQLVLAGVDYHFGRSQQLRWKN